MATVYSISQIPTLTNKKVFFDTNVLIYIFWPSGSFNWESKYSTAFGTLLRQHNELVVDFMVISEIVNRIHRIEYQNHLRNNSIPSNSLSYKKYRNSPDGQTTLSDIYLIIETNILNVFTVIGKSFSKADIMSLLVDDNLDFADKGIVMICKENNLVLLTNDTDYKNADIEILTAHPGI